jgi:hypothetical protein
MRIPSRGQSKIGVCVCGYVHYTAGGEKGAHNIIILSNKVQSGPAAALHNQNN